MIISEGCRLISEAFGRLGRYKLLFAVPIIVDLLSLLLGLSMNGFQGASHITFKLALQIGLPSISYITEQRLMPGTIQLMPGGSLAIMQTALFALLFLAIQAFLQGGYIGLLSEASEGRFVTMERLIRYGKRFFLRFLVLDVIVVILMLILGGIVMAMFKAVGAVVFTLLFLWIRILFVFLEFTMVAEDCSFSEALARCREYFRRRTSDTGFIIVNVLVFNLLMGIAVNLLWNPGIFAIGILVYNYVSAGLQFALMLNLQRIR
jgi:hypothetical protein